MPSLTARLSVGLLAGLLLAASIPASAAEAPGSGLVGTWTFLVNENTRPDGTKYDTYGKPPKGMLMFDDGGRFSLVITNPDRPKFASGNRLGGTEEENKSAVLGSIAYFGRYSVDAAGKVLTLELEASTFPNWDGTTQKRPFTIEGDELRFTNPVGSTTGAFRIVLKRLH